MNQLNGYRIFQILGAVLAIVMLILLWVGTHSVTTFIVWGILCLVGITIFAGARKLDEASPDRRSG